MENMLTHRLGSRTESLVVIEDTRVTLRAADAETEQIAEQAGVTPDERLVEDAVLTDCLDRERVGLADPRARHAYHKSFSEPDQASEAQVPWTRHKVADHQGELRYVARSRLTNPRMFPTKPSTRNFEQRIASTRKGEIMATRLMLQVLGWWWSARTRLASAVRGEEGQANLGFVILAAFLVVAAIAVGTVLLHAITSKANQISNNISSTP